MDDFDRENECDMIALGETLTKEQMATMIKSPWLDLLRPRQWNGSSRFKQICAPF